MMPATETAYFGGGCFWCAEAIFNQLRGVNAVVSGYAGGQAQKPNYQTVSAGQTGHAEVVKVEFDPQQISYQDLLSVFFATHDPTTRNRQGQDIGNQYRSLILYASPEQKIAAEDFIRQLSSDKIFPLPIVTEVVAQDCFYPAEDYQRDYYQTHSDAPYCLVVIDPKLSHLRARFGQLLKNHRPRRYSKSNELSDRKRLAI